jgi:predicted amidohydrolase
MQPQQPTTQPVSATHRLVTSYSGDAVRSESIAVSGSPTPETATATAPAAAPVRAVDVAVAQFGPYTDKQANLALLRDQVRTAAERGARVVVAPEYSMFAVTRLDQRAVVAAEPLTGPFVTALRGLASEFGVYLVAGVVETTGAAGPADRIYNTLVVLGPEAEFVTVYRKVHLYDAFGFRESDVVAPGPITDPAVFAVDGVVFGLQTCFDLRFPEGFRRLAAAGAHVLALPAQWIPGPGKVDQWATLVRARAIENTTYVTAAGLAAPRGCGTSMIVDPAGAVLAELGDQTGIATARIDLDRLDRIRTTNPSLAQRRFTIEPDDQQAGQG